jgi:hypothetical protein
MSRVRAAVPKIPATAKVVMTVFLDNIEIPPSIGGSVRLAPDGP